MNSNAAQRLIEQVVANNTEGVAAFVERNRPANASEISLSVQQLAAVVLEAYKRAADKALFLRMFLGSVEHR